MFSLGERKTEQARGSNGRRSAVFWIGRFLFVGIAAGLIVPGFVWWKERPLTLAEESLAAGDPKYARYLLTKFLDRHPRHSRAMALQARVHVALGDPETAITLFDQAGGETAEDLRAWARALLMTEQWSLAVPLLERVLQLRPEDADALYELTASRVRMGMFEEALESARRFTRLKGNEARGYLFQGAILHDLGRNAEAAAAYEKVLQYDPQAENLQSPAADFYLQYGQTLLALGKPDEALDPLKRSAAARESPEVLLELGNAAMQLGRLAHAKTAWERILVLDQQHVPAREALARAALQEGLPLRALEFLAPLVEEQSTLESAYLRQRAYALSGNKVEEAKWQQVSAELRKQQEFRSDLDNLLLDSPQSFWARVVRAHRFAQQGNWRQAELLVARLLEEAPAEPFVIKLARAVHRRRDLPALESLPITHY